MAIIINKLNEIKTSYGFYATTSYNNYLNDLCSNISIIIGIPFTPNGFSDFERKSLYEYINRLDLKKDDEYVDFIKFLEEILNYDYLGKIDNIELAKELHKAFILSNVKLKIMKDDEEFYIFPTNTEILDSALIFDSLNWLESCKEAKTHFINALKFEKKEQYYRNIIDELRLCFEFLLKKLFSNNKSLENQKSNLGTYFKDNNISMTISNMYIKLFELYTTYNNDNAKHGDRINFVEIDYIIYLTGTFIRLIMQIEENKLEIK